MAGSITTRRWITSLNSLRLTGEDFQSGVEDFGLANENAVSDNNILLVQGVGGNRTSQCGGNS